MAAAIHKNVRVGRIVSNREWLRSVSDYDERPQRNRRRRQRRWSGMETVRVQMEAGRRESRPGLVSTAPTAIGLANVVRCARVLSAKFMVRADSDRIAARQERRDGTVRKESVSGCAAAVYSRDILSLPVHQRGRTSTNWRVVET